MKTLAENKKAYFDYEILEKFEAGIVLLGQEVKSIRNKHMSLKASYVVIDKNEEIFLIGAKVPPYQPKNAPEDYDPEKPRKLLLKKKEITYLIGKSKQRGLTLVPLKVYTSRGKIKIDFAVARGKKKFDKRRTTKDREFKREKDRLLKGG